MLHVLLGAAGRPLLSLPASTLSGSPQGGVVSPLLTNCYLHQFDMEWWQRYGSMDRLYKERRRRQQPTLPPNVLTGT